MNDLKNIMNYLIDLSKQIQMLLNANFTNNNKVKGYKEYKRKSVKLKDLHDSNTTIYVPINTSDGKPIKKGKK